MKATAMAMRYVSSKSRESKVPAQPLLQTNAFSDILRILPLKPAWLLGFSPIEIGLDISFTLS